MIVASDRPAETQSLRMFMNVLLAEVEWVFSQYAEEVAVAAAPGPGSGRGRCHGPLLQSYSAHQNGAIRLEC
jgi:hypothetical protein